MHSIRDTIRQKWLHMDWRAVIVIVLSTLLLGLRYYNRPSGNYYLDGLFFYLLIPLLTILLIFRESPRHYGFTLGDWRAGLKISLGCMLAMTLVLFFVARTPDFRVYYSGWYTSAAETIGLTAADLIGWEFFFRGFLLFGLARISGPYSILLQAVPFTLAHFGKPQLETLSCIFGGTIFGWIAWRTRSFIYPFLIHWYIGVLTILFAKSNF